MPNKRRQKAHRRLRDLIEFMRHEKKEAAYQAWDEEPKTASEKRRHKRQEKKRSRNDEHARQLHDALHFAIMDAIGYDDDDMMKQQPAAQASFETRRLLGLRRTQERARAEGLGFLRNVEESSSSDDDDDDDGGKENDGHEMAGMQKKTQPQENAANETIRGQMDLKDKEHNEKLFACYATGADWEKAKAMVAAPAIFHQK